MSSLTELFKKIHSQSSSSPVEFLIVGLGNPGPKYENTRHNAGFCALDTLANDLGASCDKLKFNGKMVKTDIDGIGCILLKPQTFMNDSGRAVEQARGYYHLSPSQIIVFSDDISLEPGKIRIKRKGSHGGHNGLKDITEAIGSEEFLRIKIGVGKKPHPDYDLVKWVLGKFSEVDKKSVDSACKDAAKAAKLLVNREIDKAMNMFN